MLIKDKYVPKNFNESLLNLDISKKLKNIKTLENLIIYGINGTGKYILALMYLQNILGDDIYKRKKKFYIK